MKHYFQYLLFVVILFIFNIRGSISQIDFSSHQIHDVPIIGQSLVDFDLDGDLDIVAAHYSGNKILWLENDGAFDPSFESYDIFSHNKPRHQRTVDFDLDGDLDIVVSSNSEGINWYKNDGNNNFTQYNISQTNSIRQFFVLDFDNDSDLDIVGFNTIDDYISWWECII